LTKKLIKRRRSGLNLFLLFWDRVSLCSPSCPQTGDPPTSASLSAEGMPHCNQTLKTFRKKIGENLQHVGLSETGLDNIKSTIHLQVWGQPGLYSATCFQKTRKTNALSLQEKIDLTKVKNFCLMKDYSCYRVGKDIHKPCIWQKA
jgi:hypothetical protein